MKATYMYMYHSVTICLPVVIQHRIERLNPLGVNVSVADNPRMDVCALPHHLTGAGGEDTVCPFTSVHINVAQ